MVLFNNNYISVSNAILYIAQEICCALIISHGYTLKCARVMFVVRAIYVVYEFVASVAQFIMGMMFLILRISLFLFRTRSHFVAAQFFRCSRCGLWPQCLHHGRSTLLPSARASALADVPSK